MVNTVVTEAGFYDGKFRKAGQSISGPLSGDIEPADIEKLTKDELLAEAQRRGIEVKPSDTKAEIIKALEAN